MIAVHLSTIYLLAVWYLARRALAWTRTWCKTAHKKWFAVIHYAVFAFLALSLVIAFFLPDGTIFQRLMKLISNYWLGILLYLILFIGIADLVKIALRRSHVLKDDLYKSKKAFGIVGLFVCIGIVSMSVYGIINAQIIRTTKYDITVDKACAAGDEMKIVLMADTHLGYNIGTKMLKKAVAKVNAMDADIVCFAGDFFDNEYEALQDDEAMIELFKSIKSKYGTYACWGNHDVAEKILAGFTFNNDKKSTKLTDPRFEEFLQKADIKLLADEAVLVDDAFYIVGRRDAEKPGNTGNSRMSPAEVMAGVDTSYPVIMVDHEPRDLKELSALGVDVDLNGHTHAGQVFPGNLTIGLMWDNAYGYLDVDGMDNIVTSGIGVFGPYMRTFTKSEIVEITVHFAA